MTPPNQGPRGPFHARVFEGVLTREGRGHIFSLAAALLCASRGSKKPCLSCEGCRKALENSHPDLTVTEPEKGRAITADAARFIRSDAYVRPYEADNKVYVVFGAQNLNLHAQNALLSVLESPPPYAFFLLQADNASALLPTIRSRCVLERLPAPPLEDDAEAEARGRALYGAFCKGDELALARVLYSWDKLARPELSAAVHAFCRLARERLGQDIPPFVTGLAIEQCLYTMDALGSNASPATCCAALCVKLGEIAGGR